MITIKSQPLRPQLIENVVGPERIMKQLSRPVIAPHHPRVAFQRGVHRLVPVKNIIPPVPDKEIASGISMGQIKSALICPATLRKRREPCSTVGYLIVKTCKNREHRTVCVRLRGRFQHLPLLIKTHGRFIGKTVRSGCPSPV